MRSLLAVLALGASTLGACTLPGNHYDPTPDAAPLPQPDAPPPDVKPATPMLVVTPVATAINEGSSVPVMVSLSAPPTGAFPVTVHSSDPSVATSLPSLVFNDADYATPKVVTLTAVQDANAISEHATVTLIPEDGSPPFSVEVNVIDDDVLSIVTDAPGTITVLEGTERDVRLHLSAAPSAPVVVAVQSNSNKLTVTPTLVSFDAANYAVDQVVSFTAVTDPDTVTDDAAVAFTAAGLPSSLLQVVIPDKDVLNISVAPSSMTLTEGGGAGSLQVALTQMPSSTVTVNVSSSSPAIQLSQPTLVFTPSNYNVTQTIAVTAAQDANLTDEAGTITLGSSGLTSKEVAVTVHDDDVQSIVTNAPAQLVLNEGSTATFHVHLAFDPGGPVTVSLATQKAKVSLAPTPLTFNSSNYLTDKTVTVTAPFDADTLDEQDTISISGAAAPAVQIPVTVLDTTDLALFLSKSAMTINEGSTGTFMVSLTAQPPASLAVNVVTANPAVATVSPAALVFTAANWSSPQIVTVTAPHDADTADQTTTITVSAPALNSQIVQVTNHDTGP